MLRELVASYVPSSVAGTVTSVILLVGITSLTYIAGRITFIPLAKKALNSRDVEKHAKKPILKIAWFILALSSLTVGFAAAGFGNLLTALATISAAGTLAVGFAMQNVIKNFVSGVFIFMDEPFKIGDWIEWNGNSGCVEDIGLRVSRVRTFDNELLTVPNGELADNTVKNPVEADKLRIKVDFGIGYEDDIHEATEIILEEAREDSNILDEPEPSVRLVEFGNSDVGLQARTWIDNPDRADFVRTKGEFSTSVKERFDEEGIDMPYPHRQLTGEVRTP